MPTNLPTGKQLLNRLLFPLWRYRRRNSITILMLHSVMDEAQGPVSWVPLRRPLSPAVLATALRMLARWYRFISLEQAVAALSGVGSAPPFSMVLTFDDGYRNNLTHALPILREHNAPMTVFLSTGNVSRREPFWYDRMDYALQHLPAPCDVRWGTNSVRIDPSKRGDLLKKFHTLRYLIKDERDSYSQSMKRVETLLVDLESQARCRLADSFENDPWTALMNWDEVKRASAEGVTFGSHTVNHVLLDRLDDGEVRQELIASAQDISSHTGKPCSFLCYPNGNCSPHVVEIAREAGYLAAVVTREGVNRPGNSDPMMLYRTSLGEETDEPSICAKSSGLSSVLLRWLSPSER